MSEANSTDKQKAKVNKLAIVLFVLVFLFFAVFLSLFNQPRTFVNTHEMACRTNLKGIGTALYVYALDNRDMYPTADNWYDLLIEHVDVEEKDFLCRAMEEGRGYFALNPEATTKSADDVVLAFETPGGWN